MAGPLDAPRPRRVVLGSLITRITIVMAVFTVAVYVGIYFRTQTLIMQGLHEQAETYTQLIIETRAWNARYGGVYVEKAPGVESNPYLRDLGVDPDIETIDGTRYTLRNPALMTLEISEALSRDSGVSFRLTSLEPVNPENAPDEWERTILGEFDEGFTEPARVVQDGPAGSTYRYMVPLVVEQSCLSCHEEQGYQTGEIRGAVSVLIPIDDVRRSLGLNAIGLAGLALLTLAGIMGIVYVMASRVAERLDETERQLEHLAVTDALTDLWNRRHMIGRLKEEFDRSRRQQHDLGLIILDLDHFKDVNDRFGHAAGDAVLRAAAQRMQGAIREYDTLGRFGGEEFLIIAPETPAQGVVSLAERVREAVSADPIPVLEAELTVTASAGVAILSVSDTDPDALLARADAALYAAKGLGRDRVVLGKAPDDLDLG
jgi:diguanylate cyclase (GGDEF)-like protein